MGKAILTLNLTKQWFDMIKSGEKKEEYRQTKAHWHRIFSMGYIKIKGKYYHPTDVIIRFMNGMTPPVPEFHIECKGLRVREGKKEWGAVEGEQYYVLILGDIIAPTITPSP